MKFKKLEYDLYHPVFEPIGYMKDVMPEWFKKIEKFSGGKLSVSPSTITVKSCAPFMDAFLTGYYIPLPVDLLVEQTQYGPKISWSWFDLDYTETDFVIERDPGMIPTLPIPKGFSPNHFSWSTKQILKVENGYSLLITHPLNRDDLPFRTMSGVVDANYPMSGGKLPFLIQEGFEGIIKAGTPIAQIIPIKSEPWKLERNTKLLSEAKLARSESLKTIIGWYKNKYWNRKEYN
jgi:hypothetical protein